MSNPADPQKGSGGSGAERERDEMERAAAWAAIATGWRALAYAWAQLVPPPGFMPPPAWPHQGGAAWPHQGGAAMAWPHQGGAAWPHQGGAAWPHQGGAATKPADTEAEAKKAIDDLGKDPSQK
jgi:hypothetical protein